MILNYNTELGLTPAAAYPDLTESDPRKKGKAYWMQYARAFFTHYLQSGSRDFLNGRRNGRYQTAELYAGGRQPVKAILKDEDGQADLHGQKADLKKPLKLMPKYLRAVDGKLKDHDFTATVTPIDATAQDERRAYEAAMRVQMEHGEFLKSLGIPPPGGAAGPEVPIDEDELNLHMEVKYRHRDAMLMEMKLSRALYLAEYPQQNRACLRDETIYGSSVLYLALRGAHRLPVRLNPGNCLFLPSDTENYAHLQGGAHIEKISLAALLKEVEADPDTTLSTDELDRLSTIAKLNMPGQGSGRNAYYDDSLGNRPEMAGQLEVLRFSFKSQDAVVMKEYTNKFGNKQVRDKPATYTGQSDAKGTVHRRTVASWYEGTMIIGTDLGYGCRKAYEQLRDEDNPFDCHPLYIVTSPDLLGGYSESVVEQCMSLCDEASSAWSRARFKLATMRGSWIEFDLDAIESALEKDGTVQKTIAGFMKDGIIIGRKQTTVDEGGTPRPIVTAGEMPFEREVNMQFQVIEQCKAQMEAITGINGSISAQDPASRQGAGVTQLAIAGAENTLDYLYHAKQGRFERVVRALAVAIKQTEDRQPLTGPVPVGDKVEIVGTSDTLSQRVLTCKVERKPTEQQWANFYETAKVALTQKEITLSDFSFLMQIDNLKQATAMLGIRAKRNQMQAAQSAQQQTSMQAEQASASAVTTAEEARKTMELEYRLKMALEELKGRNTAAVAEIQKNGHLDAQELIGLLKLQQQQAQNDHATNLHATEQGMKVAAHGADLEAQASESDAQRQHEAEMAAAEQAAQPAPAAA